EKGCLQKFGVSVYDPETVESLSGWLSLDIVQCPVNILDQRFIQEDMKEIYAKHHIEVYARSLFLQGVLLAEKLPLGLSNLEPSWNRFQSMCKNENLTPLQMCLLFAKASSSVSKWVIGVNLATELSGIMDCWKSLPNQIPNYDLLQCENVVHVDPRNWAVQ
ncbi:MAG: hypothetical protein HOI80_03350, partial [Alphaproteobacteria bacterium]|nr:hypothetical protein [Alphaproteobacteria bacterium]